LVRLMETWKLNHLLLFIKYYKQFDMPKAAKKNSKKPLNKKVAVNKKTAKKRMPGKKAATKAKNPPLAKTSKPVKGTGKIDEVTIRMYCHGFGDCFLITFRSNGETVYRMLIDCGMLTGNSDLLKQCIENIKDECGGMLDLVVQSHEHKDHISGFNLKNDNKKLLWDSIEVADVWLAWTENTAPGGDDLAIDLKKKFEKKKKALAKALAIYNNQIGTASHKSLMDSEFRGTDYYAAQQRYATALQQLLNFYDIGPVEVQKSLGSAGALGLTMTDAMTYFIERNKKNGTPNISYWEPGSLADVTTTGLEGIKFYFLGPPKNYDLLRKMDDKEHVEMYLSDFGLSDNFYLTLADTNRNTEAISPFQAKYFLEKENISKEELKDPDNVWQLYYAKNEWRKIETDWLNNAGILALHLDSYTNNTSLVIAIEFENSGKVLLFPADAQIGNWISWTETEKEGSTSPKLQWAIKNNTGIKKITATDLLERTVFYKVGHHASHNATAKKHGLELMSKDLVAMIPVDEEVAKKQGKAGWKMPAEDLYERLLEKTKGRIIRLDKGNLLKKGVNEIPAGAKPTQQERLNFNKHVKESDIILETGDGIRRPMYWEYTVQG